MSGAELTLREHFAGLFAAALLTHADTVAASIPRRAVTMADALILELLQAAPAVRANTVPLPPVRPPV